MSVICKFFINERTQGPNGTTHYHLGVVCRGETNKDWAAATPSGNLKCPSNDTLDEVWGKKLANPGYVAEVYVTTTPDPEGEWAMESCNFTGGGVGVKYRKQNWQTGQGEMNLTVNAKPATATLRKDFADALMAGVPMRYTLAFMPAEQPDATVE